MGRTATGQGLALNQQDVIARGPRRPFWQFLFAGVLLSDLLFIALNWYLARFISKPLLVPVLLATFIAAGRPKRGAMHRFIIPALVFSWLGDVLLLFEDRAPLFFILGLGSFLVGHICYCLFFLRIWKKERLRRHWPFASGVAVYYAGLLFLLWPGLGAMKLPVLVYGAVISAMLLLALHTVLLPRRRANHLLMPGAVLFVLSDSILAINRFLQPLPLAGIAIMLTYGLAQWLLVRGALAYGANAR